MTCTRCRQENPIHLVGTLECGVPYKLCGVCYAYYRLLDRKEQAEFAITLWQQGAVQALAPEGRA